MDKNKRPKRNAARRVITYDMYFNHSSYNEERVLQKALQFSLQEAEEENNKRLKEQNKSKSKLKTENDSKNVKKLKKKESKLKSNDSVIVAKRPIGRPRNSTLIKEKLNKPSPPTDSDETEEEDEVEKQVKIKMKSRSKKKLIDKDRESLSEAIEDENGAISQSNGRRSKNRVKKSKRNKSEDDDDDNENEDNAEVIEEDGEEDTENGSRNKEEEGEGEEEEPVKYKYSATRKFPCNHQKKMEKANSDESIALSKLNKKLNNDQDEPEQLCVLGNSDVSTGEFLNFLCFRDVTMLSLSRKQRQAEVLRSEVVNEVDEEKLESSEDEECDDSDTSIEDNNSINGIKSKDSNSTSMYASKCKSKLNKKQRPRSQSDVGVIGTRNSIKTISKSLTRSSSARRSLRSSSKN